MKILVYGAGVLGCNLARNLFRAGKNVTLLARGKWAEEIEKNGLRIKDKFSLCTSVSSIPVVTELTPDAQYDVIFVVLRYTQLDSVLDTLRANRTKNIVFVGNNVQTRALAAELPDKNVLFAFALSAGHRENDRVVSIDLKKITIGQLAGAASNKQLIEQIFSGTKYRVVYEPNMEDYLLCHAAFVMPAAFACYKTDGDLKKLKRDAAYLERLIDANIEGYRAIQNAGHAILPKADADFESEKYRKTCLRFFKLMCATSLGKLCASDHAMNAIDEMSALNRDIKGFFDENGAAYPVWQELEAELEVSFALEPRLPMTIERSGSDTSNDIFLSRASTFTFLATAGLMHSSSKVCGFGENFMTSIFSPPNSRTMLLTREPPAPTHAPTGSILLSELDTAIFVR